ncbi:MAG TPA: PIN domain-containing protein [Pseudomonadota bacterium]|nr:PIN domain-containing protein [Pseudomonadota bacterium]
MTATTFRVVLDANVLYPFTLRDTLLQAAEAGLYQVYWSAEILDEALRNLEKAGKMNPAQCQHLQTQLTRSFPEAMVSGYEPLLAYLQNHPKDRHVVAAAMKAGAQVIVTLNLRDFQSLPDEIEALSPDDFLCDLLDLSPLQDIIEQQAGALRKPPSSVQELLVGLEKTVPNFVAAMRLHLGSSA